MFKTEDTNAAKYERVNNLLVRVVQTPIVIQTPPSVLVPRGGCSLPLPIQLYNQPYNSVFITLQYDSILLPESIFNIDLQYSDQIITYHDDILVHYVSFCLTKQFSQFQQNVYISLSVGGTVLRGALSLSLSHYLVSILPTLSHSLSLSLSRTIFSHTSPTLSFSLPLSFLTFIILYLYLLPLLGTNSQAYSLSNTQVQLVAVKKSNNIVPTLSMTLISTGLRNGTVEVLISTDGTFLYHIFVKGSVGLLSKDQIVQQVKQG